MDEQTNSLVLGLAGSPCRGGSTDKLLDAFLAGAQEAGAETKLLQIPLLKIAPCDDCDGCARDGKCAIEDDFQEVNRQIIAADVIVLSAPLYFAGLPARVKCLVDRSQCQWVRKYRLHASLPLSQRGYARRKGILLCAGGDPHANFEGVRRTVRYFFNVYETNYSDELLIAGADRQGAIDTQVLQAASALGRQACACRKDVKERQKNRSLTETQECSDR